MRKFSNLEPFIFFVLLLVLVANIAFSIFSKRDAYLAKFDFVKTDNLYRFSQFAPKEENRKFIIEDPELYSYSGYQYLRGTNPGLLNTEHPPLAKYFFGASIFLFGNATYIQSIFGVLLLLLIFLIAKEIFKDRILSLIPPLLLSFDGIFQDQFVYPFLDLSHVLFISLAILFFLKAKNDGRFYFLSSLFLGATIASKYLGFAIIPLLAVFVVLRRKQDLRIFLPSLLLIPTVFLLSYAHVFLTEGIGGFISLHGQIFRLYRSYLPNYPWGEIWRMLFFGDWRVWFGPTPFIRVGEWNLFWPLSLGSLFFALALLKKSSEALVVIILWAFLYLISASFHVIFPRHLILYLPFAYILLTFVGQKLIEGGLLYVNRYRRKRS